MSTSNELPIKRVGAFWFILGAFLLFGIFTLIIAPAAKKSDYTAAEMEGAKRRLAVRQLVEEEQAKNFVRLESGGKVQLPPHEVFSIVGAGFLSTKPVAVQEERFRDPALIQAEGITTSSSGASSPNESPAQ